MRMPTRRCCSIAARSEPHATYSPSGTGTTPPAPATALPRGSKAATATTRPSAFAAIDFVSLCVHQKF